MFLFYVCSPILGGYWALLAAVKPAERCPLTFTFGVREATDLYPPVPQALTISDGEVVPYPPHPSLDATPGK